MRKLFVMGMVMVLAITMAMAIPAQAVEFKVSGMADATTYLLGNYSYKNSAPVADKKGEFTSSFIDERMRVDLNALVTKDLGAVIKMELDSTNWGDNGDGRNNAGKLNADRAAFEVRNAYIDANLPYVPVNLKAGIYGFYYRPHVFLFTDATGVNLTIKADPITITPFYYKGYEGAYDKNDDIDFYGLLLDYTGKALKVGAYGLYVNTGDFDASTRSAFSYPYPGNYTGFNATRTGNFYWAGVYADGGIGNFLFRFDAITNWGKLEDKSTATSQDVDYRGGMVYGKAWYDMKHTQIGLVGMYSTGDDAKNTTKVEGFRLPPGSESYALFMEGLIVYPSPFNAKNGYMTFSLDAANNAYNFQPYRGYGGTYLAKAFATVNPAQWLSCTGMYSFIGDTVKNGNRFGSASDKNDIGQEVDLYTKLTLTKNLTYDIGLGYLFAGDALKRNDQTDPANAWAVITRLLLTF